MLSKFKKFFHNYFKKKKFNYKRIENQNFAFPDPILYYIIKSYPWILESLNLTCKFWFANFSYIFVEILGDKRTAFYPSFQGYFLETKGKSILAPQKICDKFPPLKLAVTNTLSYVGYHKQTPETRLKLPKFFQQIYFCRLKILHMVNQDLSFDEWNLFTSSKTIKKVNLRESSVLDKNDRHVYLEDLLYNLENIVEAYFLLNDEQFSDETAQKLLDFKFRSVFKHFHLGLIPLTFDLETFLLFAKKNIGLRGEVVLYSDEFNYFNFFGRRIIDMFANAKESWGLEYKNVLVRFKSERELHLIYSYKDYDLL